MYMSACSSIFSRPVHDFYIFLTARLAALEVAERTLLNQCYHPYWGREDDLDIEYSLIFQPNTNSMLAHCLRHWLNINPTLRHVTSRVWLDVVGAVCDTSCEIGGYQTCAAYCRAGVVDSGPALKQHSCQRSNLGQTEKIFLESPHSNKWFLH